MCQARGKEPQFSPLHVNVLGCYTGFHTFSPSWCSLAELLHPSVTGRHCIQELLGLEKTFKLLVLLPTAGPARKEVPDDPTEGDFGQGVLAETGKGAEKSLAVLQRKLGQLAQGRVAGEGPCTLLIPQPRPEAIPSCCTGSSPLHPVVPLGPHHSLQYLPWDIPH